MGLVVVSGHVVGAILLRKRQLLGNLVDDFWPLKRLREVARFARLCRLLENQILPWNSLDLCERLLFFDFLRLVERIILRCVLARFVDLELV